MVTKHNRELWPYEPQVMSDDEQENAYTRLLEQEDEPPIHGGGVIKFLTGLTICVILLLNTLAAWHFIAWWLA